MSGSVGMIFGAVVARALTHISIAGVDPARALALAVAVLEAGVIALLVVDFPESPPSPEAPGGTASEVSADGREDAFPLLFVSRDQARRLLACKGVLPCLSVRFLVSFGAGLVPPPSTAA